MTIDDGAKNGRRSTNKVLWIGAAVVCLLLLLTVILVAHNTNAINRWDTKYESLVYNLTKDRKDTVKEDAEIKKARSSSLTQDQDFLRDEQQALEKERNQLRNFSSSLTKERGALKDERDVLRNERNQLAIYFNNLTKERDALREERDALKDERVALKEDRDQLKIQSSNLTEYRNALEEEKDSMRAEREAMTAERGVLKGAQDYLKILTFNITKDRDTLRDERDALRNERDQLKVLSSNRTKEIEALQARNKALTASRDRLQVEVNRLQGNETAKTCFPGWSIFKNKCYYFSRKGQSETWDVSKKDCQERGGELAMPKTLDELTFVSRSSSYTWIGLSDKLQEGVWEWVDGTQLEMEFWKEGEPNDTGNEDCVEVSRDEVKWNDAPCNRKFSWACEA